MNKEPDHVPPLPPLRRSDDIKDYLPLPPKRGGGFIPTPSYTDITSLREANATLKGEVGILKGRVKSLEDAVLMLAKHVGIWEEVLTNLQ